MQAGTSRPGITGVVGLIVAVLLVVALAGCQRAPVTEPLLQETVHVGEPIFDFGEARHFGPEPFSSVKRINASFDVGPGLFGFGVGFQGSFNWLNSTATLRIDRPDGSRALELVAREGVDDDVGPVGRVFQFHRFVEAGPSPGWRVVAIGHGNISALDFRLHGIEQGETGVERGFTVPVDDLELRLRLDARGWGRAPTGVLVAPDGSSTPIELVDPRGGAIHDWTAREGEYTLRLDTSGWGGSLILEVLPV